MLWGWPGVASHHISHFYNHHQNNHSSKQAWSTVPRPPITSCFSATCFNGITIETQILKSMGYLWLSFHPYSEPERPLSDKCSIILGNLFFPGVNTSFFIPRDYPLPHILAFLQSGLDKNLALSTLRWYTSALSILFQNSLTLLSLVRLYSTCHRSDPHYSTLCFLRI